jgi:hypothetical protein
MNIEDCCSVIVRAMKLVESNGLEELVDCDREGADLFCIYIEDMEGELHSPEEIGLEGEFECTDFRVADMTAHWISHGLMHQGGRQ